MTCLLREIDESREMAKVVEKMKLKEWMDEERKKTLPRIWKDSSFFNANVLEYSVYLAA